MKLVEQWQAIESALPQDWEDVRLTLTAEQESDLPRAAQLLGSINVGKVGSSLVFHVVRAGGAHGPLAVQRLFERLDRERTWCVLEQSGLAAGTEVAEPPPLLPHPPAHEALAAAESWDAALAPLPADWTDLLCELEVESSDYLDRTALLCAPLNPTRDASRLVFTFRCSGRSGYGVSRPMARRCFERLDAEGIGGRTRILRVLSDTDNVDTQGPVWLVGGKTL